MSQDDETARKIRAQKLRAQISKLRKPDAAGESDSAEEEESEPQHGKSPREFIEERMRELDNTDE